MLWLQFLRGGWAEFGGDMKKRVDKKDFLVATESSVFEGGDEDVVLPDDIASFMESDENMSVSLPLGGEGQEGAPEMPGMVDVPDGDGEVEEPMTGKKAALFGSVEPSSEDRETFDWLKMEDSQEGGRQEAGSAVDNLVPNDAIQPVVQESAPLEGDALMEALNAEALVDGDEDDLSSGANSRKAALFNSVEATDEVKANFGFERRENAPAFEEPAAPMASNARVVNAADAVAAVEVAADMNKIATDASAESTVFGAAGGRVITGKASGDLAKRLKALNEEQIVGLDLWDDGATACFAKYSRGKVLITHAGHLEFSAGAGDAERIAELKAFWKGMKFPTRSVWVNVHNASLLQKYVRYDVPVDDLEPYLRRDAEESMSGAGGSVVLDWVMKSQPGGGGEGILFALPVWEQEHLLSSLRMAGLYVCGLSVAACDLARLFTLMRPGDNGAQCICSLSNTGADIVIVYGNGALYSRTIYSRSGGWEENLSYLYECLNDAINYFNSWINKSPVSSVMLCGRVPEVGDLVGELLQETGLLGEVWNPVLDGGLFEMVGSARKSGVSGRALAGALGLALQRG